MVKKISKERRLVNKLTNKNYEKKAPIMGDMFIPNTSGVTNHQEFKGYFKGMIVLWSGSIANIPNGWVICDGNNGTPDLRNNFIIGAGDTYAVDDTGGNSTHDHTGITSYFAHNKVLPLGNAAFVAASQQHGHSISSDNHLPPYYALAYIMKT